MTTLAHPYIVRDLYEALRQALDYVDLETERKLLTKWLLEARDISSGDGYCDHGVPVAEGCDECDEYFGGMDE